MPNDKKMKRLEALLDSFDSGAVQPEELIQAIEAVMAIIDTNGKTLVDKIVETEKANEKDIAGLKSELAKTRDNLQSVINQVKDNSDTSVSSVKKALLSEIKRVEALIPVLPPETDLSEVFNEIESQKQSLANLSFLIVGENIRNALESLQGDDRLDKSAIKGFDEEVGKSTSKYMKDGIGLVVRQLVAGSGVTIDNSNQEYPIITSTGGGAVEGTSILSTGETVGKVLQADGDNTSSWVTLAGGGNALTSNPLSQFAATTKAQLDGVISDGNVMYIGDAPTAHTHTASEVTDFSSAVAATASVTANTAKVTNATHTGQVTGATTLTVDKTAISDQTDTVITASDTILFGDATDTNNLKKDTVQGILDLVTGGGHTIEDEGTPLTQRTKLNFVGAGVTVTDDAGDDATVVTISGGGAVATDTIWDAKGDLAVATATDTATKLAVGANGQVLTADSAEATGVKWSTVAGTGDVTATANITDNAIVRGDGGAKGVQESLASVSDTGIAIFSENNGRVADWGVTPNTASLFNILGGTTNGQFAISRASTTDAAGPAFIGYRAMGTVSSPTTVTANAELMQYSGRGYDGTSWSNSQGEVSVMGSETWSGTAHGTYIKMSTTPNASTTEAEQARVTDAGISVSTGNGYMVNSVEVLNATTLGSSVTSSSLTSFGTSPTLVTPALGTPASGVMTNVTGTASGLTAGNVTTNANLTGPVTSVGNATAIADSALSIAKTSGLQTALNAKAPLASPTFTGTVVLPNSQALVTPVLGTPTSVTLTNATGLPVSGITASTSTALGVGSIELGHASDTTVSRSSAGVIAVEGVVIPSISSTNTLTNKRVTKRTGTTTSHATPTINTDNVDEYYITAQTEAITSFTTNLSGTATQGQMLYISVIGTAARAITWGASFGNGPVALPTTTVTTTELSVLFKYDGSVWRCFATGSRA